MKKKILFGFAILAIVTVAAFNMNLILQKSELSGISLANVETLAQGEEFTITCSYASCHGKWCHQDTYNWLCPCRANGDPLWGCML